MMGRGKIDLFWKKVFRTTKDNNYVYIRTALPDIQCHVLRPAAEETEDKSLLQQIPVLIYKLCAGDKDIMQYVDGVIAGKHKKCPCLLLIRFQSRLR